MREKIENTLKAILKHVGQCGSCYGTEIGSRDEMRWLETSHRACPSVTLNGLTLSSSG